MSLICNESGEGRAGGVNQRVEKHMRGNIFDMKREKTQGGGESLFTVLEELHAALAQLASFPFPLWIGTSIQQQRGDFRNLQSTFESCQDTAL